MLRLRNLGLLTAALLLSAGTARAVTVAPNVSLKLDWGLTDTSLTGHWTGSDVGDPTSNPNVFQYTGVQTGTNWSVSWSMLGDPDPSVNGNYSVQNNTNSDQIFVLTVILPISPAVTPSSLVGGSMQGGVTDNDGNGATLTTVGTTALFIGQIDGAAVPGAFAYAAPYTVTAGNYSSANIPSAAFGTPIPSLPGPAALSDIALQFKFKLSAHDSASFTGVFVVQPVPEPGTFALATLGLAGLTFLGRRRKD